MQLTLIPRGDLIPGKDIESAAWLGMRANQNEIFSYRGEVTPGLVGPFVTTSSALTQSNQAPGGLSLATWNPIHKPGRKLLSGDALTAQVFGGSFRIVFRFTRVSAVSSTVIFEEELIRIEASPGWTSADFVVPSVPAGNAIVITALAGRVGREGRIEQFFLREKISTGAEIP